MVGLSDLPRRCHQATSDLCGSRSTIATRLLSLAALTDSAEASVVLPVPPFELTTAITFIGKRLFV